MPAKIMGIINATPDSFYDGNPENNLEALLAKCKQYLEDGADILDIGGESTRPGATPVSAEEELARTLPLIQTLRKLYPQVTLSQDTFKIPVALEGLKAGVQIINDVSGTPDKEMFNIVKDFNARLVITHSRGTPQTMQTLTDYNDLLQEVRDFLDERIRAAQAAGLRKENLLIDPGFGFAKTREQNYRLLNHLDFFKPLGVPMLIGLSHKKFLGLKGGEKAPKRKAQTLAANLVALQGGADILRVHDVKETKKVVQFFNELKENL